MKKIRLYDWNDPDRTRVIHEVEVLRVDDMTRNGKERLFVWSAGNDDFNYMLYPAYGTAYPEYENRIQQQRYAERYFYEALD